MKGEEVYKIYAPLGVKWIDWIRPVPFVAIDTYNRKPISNWVDRKVMFLNQYQPDTAIFIDLPGKESIELGIALARIGYRPIPLFNGTDEQKGSQAIIDTDIVECSLINGSEILKNIIIKDDANPAFLLDSFRINRFRSKNSIFDNSWDLYKQDIPTYEYFKQNNINKIIIVGNTIQKDLKKIFWDFQKKGMKIYLTDGFMPLKEIKIKKHTIY